MSIIENNDTFSKTNYMLSAHITA